MDVAQIKQLRQKHSLSQEQLANVLGVSFTTVNAWETGKRTPQHSMRALLEKLSSVDQIQNFKHLDSAKDVGFARSDAGFVSSVISYEGRKDESPYTHGIGRWYGCLPSFFVRDIVKFCGTDLDAPQRALVNFGGSGTVPLEFGIAGISSYSIDVNPVAFLLTYIKTQLLKPISEKRFQEIRSSARDSADRAAKQLPFDDPNLLHSVNKWVTPEAQDLFLSVISVINANTDTQTQIILAVALINIAINYCQIDKRCTNHYVYRKNFVSAQKFWSDYEAEVQAINEKLRLLKRVDGYAIPSLSIQDNRSTTFSSGYFDVVFSHPPYGNMINYYSMSRVQLSILGSIALRDKALAKQVGDSLSHAKSSDQSSSTYDHFTQSISGWVKEAHRVLKNKGHLIVVIGDGRSQGYLNHPHTEIVRVAESLGMRLRELFIWITENKSGMHVRRKGHHIDHNYVLVLQKLAF
jgi:transcriptional regulator with XRE-family HTH domain